MCHQMRNAAAIGLTCDRTMSQSPQGKLNIATIVVVVTKCLRENTAGDRKSSWLS